jgi:3-ketosteroid 9alpha-monooxygenase subunit A
MNAPSPNLCAEQPGIRYVPIAARSELPAFPTGWFVVAASEDLSSERMLPLHYLGRQLIGYRTVEGEARVADAYCPHLGAHLASHTGELKAGVITCPFHRWRYDSATGACVGISYAEKIPSRAKLSFYPVREIDGLIFAFIDGQGRAPTYEPHSEHELLGEGEWVRMPMVVREMKAQAQEMMENIFDPGHTLELHNSGVMPKFENINFDGAFVEIISSLPVPDPVCPKITIVTRYSGVSYLSQTIHGKVTILRLTAYTPIDGDTVERKTWMYIRKGEFSGDSDWLAQGFFARYQVEIDQDLAILKYKRFTKSPLLCDGDGPIMKWRRHTEQFYR